MAAGGARWGAVPEAGSHGGPGRDRAPGDVSLRLHLPPAVRPGAAPLSGGALRARSRGPPHHRPLRALRGRHGGAREGGDPAMGGGLSGGLDLNGRALEIADRMATNAEALDRKSTRLNSSHGYISYAVFCLKKKKNN